MGLLPRLDHCINLLQAPILANAVLMLYEATSKNDFAVYVSAIYVVLKIVRNKIFGKCKLGNTSPYRDILNGGFKQKQTMRDIVTSRASRLKVSNLGVLHQDMGLPKFSGILASFFFDLKFQESFARF